MADPVAATETPFGPPWQVVGACTVRGTIKHTRFKSESIDGGVEQHRWHAVMYSPQIDGDVTLCVPRDLALACRATIRVGDEVDAVGQLEIFDRRIIGSAARVDVTEELRPVLDAAAA